MKFIIQYMLTIETYVYIIIKVEKIKKPLKPFN